MTTRQKFDRWPVRLHPLWFGIPCASMVACSVLLANDARQCNKDTDCDKLIGGGHSQCQITVGVCQTVSQGGGGGIDDTNMSMSGATPLSAGSGGAPSAGSGGRQSYLLPAYVSDGALPSTIPGVRNAGKEFSIVGATVRVRDLGIYDDHGNGLQNEHTVTLFSLEQFGVAQAVAVPGGSTVVPRGTIATLESGYRYQQLPSPVDLPPGKYAVVAFGLNSMDPPGDGGGIPLSSTGVADANFDPFQFIDAASPAFPNGGDSHDHANASIRYESPIKPLRILCLGGSVTDGVKGTLAGYRGPLKNLLDTAGVVFQYVGSAIDNPGVLPREQRHHDGHPQMLIAASGAPSEGGQGGQSQSLPLGLYDSRVDLLGPSGSQADLILLSIGTDDVDQNNQLDTAADRLDALVTSILDPAIGLQPNAKLILAEIPPIGDPEADARAVEFNKAVLSVAQAHKSQAQAITTVDLHSALTTADLADNLQPNDAGYAKIAKVFFEAIRGT